HADQARQSKELATMRRDLELDCDPAELVLQPPDRSQLREMFRRLEFRNLLGRVDHLDEAVPAMPMRVEGTDVAWMGGESRVAVVRHPEIPRRLASPLLERVRERGGEHLYREIELPLTAVLAAMEDAGVKIDTYRMGEITARLADRVEELEAKAYELAGEEFMLGSTQQVARVLFEKLGLTPGRKGKTGYSTDT